MSALGGALCWLILVAIIVAVAVPIAIVAAPIWVIMSNFGATAAG